MGRRQQVYSTYARIARTYVRWAPSLLLLAVVVFVPLGLLHAIALEAELGSISFTASFKLLAVIAAVLALAATGLVGEVFYTGAVAISLTHPHHGESPSLREIARMVDYGPLIAIDLIYGALVAVGLVIFFVPGVLAFVWLGLAAPIVEIEHTGTKAAFARSVRLVRRRFFVVATVLIPIELLGDGLTDLAVASTHGAIGSEFICDWLADVLANLAFTPFYAVAAVLLTVDLIGEKGGEVKLRPHPGGDLHSKPVP